jgi:PLP dependent protein
MSLASVRLVGWITSTRIERNAAERVGLRSASACKPDGVSDNIGANLHRVLGEIESARAKAGADPIRLIAISKTVPPDRIWTAYRAGQREFGENRVQEAIPKIESLHNLMPEAIWHLVGHLQTNKSRPAAIAFSMVQSLDSLRLARRIDRDRSSEPSPLPVLLEVNVSGEAAKSGFTPSDLEASFDQLLALEHVELSGLMTVPPQVDDPQDVRWVFRSLREIRDDIQARRRLPKFRELSMGMSSDFRVAIEEGATMVRIGQAIFGTRAAGLRVG